MEEPLDPRKRTEPTARQRLGDVLVRRGLITAQALEDALKAQRGSGKRLGEMLVERGALTEVQLTPVLAQHLKLQYIDVVNLVLGTNELTLLSEALARKYTVLPLRQNQDRLEVVMADPLDFEAIRDLSFARGCKITPSIGCRSHITDAIDRFYARHLEGAGALMAAGVGESPEQVFAFRSSEPSALDADSEEAPVIQLLNLILRKAIQLGASDIHVEPGSPGGIVRFRLDGLLQDQLKVPPRLHPALVSRLKILGKMDIAERRLPQDGSVRVKVDGRDADLRLSTMPLRSGEKAVIRILDTSSGGYELDAIGFLPDDLHRMNDLITRHKGMIVVTGPTGSGKTTTLYAILNRIKSPAINIVTVEDPIEYHYPGLNQMQVNPDIELTFAKGLRSILRQDPDVVLVGEIRDAETAEIACRAALTGHLVFTTLHTNDAPTTITRLLDIGIPRYLLASVLAGIIAQRLVRRICPDCKAPAEPKPHVVSALGLTPTSVAEGRFMMGKGCSKCQELGYKGRMAVFEMLVMNSRIRDLILRDATEEDVRLAAQESGMHSLMQDALSKAKAGLTTLDELGRVLEVAEHAANSCSGCGRPINSEYRHCPYCRTLLRRVCSCGHTIQVGWSICAHCGKEP